MDQDLNSVDSASDARKETESAVALLREVARVLERDPRLDADTVRHALALLRLDPLSRLNRSLIRGRAAAHRT